MSSEHENTSSIRRIVLPSGRTIEVISFGEREDLATRELHVCPDCGSNLVQPVSWNEADDGCWELTLEFPNCDRVETGTFSRLQVEMLEDQLDNGLSDMIADLQRLTQANMAAAVNRFAAALEADLVLPEDF